MDHMVSQVCGGAVSKFVRERLQPLVLEMDEKQELSRPLIQEFFDNGVRRAIFALILISVTYFMDDPILHILDSYY